MQKTKLIFISIIFIIISNSFIHAQSIKFDKKLGKHNYEEVVKTYGLYNNTKMSDYLNKVGQKLISQLDSAKFEYKFYIINQQEPNAFALPGGYIFITTGIIPILESEDELAGIIGHEIIHSNNRHSVRQLRKKILPTILTLPIKIVAATVPGTGAITAPITTTENLIFASYSKKFENEADEQGITLAAKAGYNPLALAKALNRLMKTTEYITGKKERKSYFADHPYTPKRDKKIKDLSNKIEKQKTNYISSNFLAEFNGITFGKNTSRGILVDNKFIHLENNIFIEFPKNWKVSNGDTIITGYSSKKNSAFSLMVKSSTLTAKKAGEKYIKNLSNKQKKLFVKSEPYKVNNTEGFLVSLQETFFSDTTYAYILWINIDNRLVEINAMSNIKNDKALVSITKSVRTLTNEEKSSVKRKYIKVVKANKETIEELCKRTNNVIKPELIAILNSRNINDILNKGDEIKIVLEEPYIQK